MTLPAPTRRRPGRIGRLAPLVILAGLASAFAACGAPAPSGAAVANPSPVGGSQSIEVPRAELVVGCVSIEAPECRFVAERVVAFVPAARGPVFAVESTLYPCANVAAPCPRTLGARIGKAVVEFFDQGEPIELSLKGPPQAPEMALLDAFYLGLSNPASARVAGPGPWPFDIGHCGISHVIDFDGSFWVPVGQVDGESPTIVNSESGTMRLVGPNLAEFRGQSGFTVQLARFPGPKHFWGCD